MTKEETEPKEGHCPKCGSSDLHYGVMDFLEDSVFYPVDCNDCGHETEAHYDLKFVGFAENF